MKLKIQLRKLSYFINKLAASSNPCPWLQTLYKKGYLNAKNNPEPIEVSDKEGYYKVPHWDILDFLDNVATKNKNNQSEKITKILIEIIESIIDYSKDMEYRNNRTDWIISKIIFKLPIDYISPKHIRFLDDAFRSKINLSLISSEIYKSIIPTLIDEKAREILLDLLDIILDFKIDENSNINKYTSLMDNYYLKNILEEYISDISEICGIQAVNIASEKVNSIIENDESQFNCVWITTIEDHKQTSFKDRYQCQLVYFIRDIFLNLKPSVIKEVVEKFINKEHHIFKRIAIYSINSYYKDLKELFWSWDGNPLEYSNLKHEIYELLKNNCNNFEDQEINKIINWIESKNYYIPDEIKGREDKINKLLAYRKKEWLSAIVKSHNSKIKNLYQRYNKINPEELDHPGFIYWSEQIDGETKLIDKNKFTNKSVKEIKDFLIKKLEENKGDFYNELELSRTFSYIVQDSPEKFMEDIRIFMVAPNIYKDSLLDGLIKVIDKREDISIERIIDFIYDLLKSDNFWNNKYQSRNINYRLQFNIKILIFFNKIFKINYYNIKNKYIIKIEDLLKMLVEKIESNDADLDNLSNIMGATKEKVYSCMMSLIMYSAKLSEDINTSIWYKSLKDYFNKKLSETDNKSLEFSAALGKNIHKLNQLDNDWINSKINIIFPKQNIKHWKTTFISYLYHSNAINKHIYFLLRQNNHYDKALKTNFNEIKGDLFINDKIVQHICIGYLQGWEKLDGKNSLMYNLLKLNKIDQLYSIVEYFVRNNDKFSKEDKYKIKQLWSEIFKISSKQEDKKEYRKLLSNLFKWIDFFESIDEDIVEWLKVSAKYIDLEYNTHFYIEKLKEHVINTPEYVGKLLLITLKEDIYPYYPKEDIKSIVKALYKNNKEIADRICNLYGTQGYEFLKDIYNQHNK